MGTALNALQVLVKIGYVGSATGFDVGAALRLLEVIPPVPLVAARLPAVALTGFLSGLTLRDLLAVASDVVWGQTRWEVPQALGEFSTQLLVLLAASHYASS